MSKLTIFCFLMCFNKLQSQVLRINGTWINEEVYNSVHQDKVSGDLNQIIPRCVYIDSFNKMTIEYRYEQKSKTSVIDGIVKKEHGVCFKALERNFSIINDSTMLLINNMRKIIFKKISDRADIGYGIKELLKQYFWSGHQKWKMITFDHGRAIDTIPVSIHGWSIYEDAKNAIFRRYEFTDVARYNVNGEYLFGVVFFKVNKKNMTDSNEVFAIKRSSDFVYMYKERELFYKLSPIK